MPGILILPVVLPHISRSHLLDIGLCSRPPVSKIGDDDRVSKHRPDPKVGKEPAPSRHRSPILSQTVRGNRRIAVEDAHYYGRHEARVYTQGRRDFVG